MEVEVERLLQIALTYLDQSGRYMAAAHVAQALAVLSQVDGVQSADVADRKQDPVSFRQTADFTPTWGMPVPK